MLHSFENKKEILKDSVAEGYLLAQCNNRDLVHITVVAGGEIKPHPVPVRVSFYVVSGKGLVIINDQKMQAATRATLAFRGICFFDIWYCSRKTPLPQ